MPAVVQPNTSVSLFTRGRQDMKGAAGKFYRVNPEPALNPKHRRKLKSFFISSRQIKASDNLWCQNFIPLNSSETLNTYILFSRKILPLQKFKGSIADLINSKVDYVSKEYMVSWNTASKWCKSINAYLPYFSSREELDELLALLKLLRGIPPLEGIFIGIKINKSVSF